MNILTITSENFENEVMKSKVPVIVDFWATWCGPCSALAPILEEALEEVGSNIKFGKVNIDSEIELAQKYNVMSIPTLLVIKNGEVVKTSVGLITKEEVGDLLK